MKSISAGLMIGILSLVGMVHAKPHVRILATGGTIAGTQAVPGQGGYKAGVLTVEALIASAPSIVAQAEISAEQVANIPSNEMTDEVWLKLVRRVETALADPLVDGVVITHGTDTLEESAWLLELTTGSDKPVVLVGSMRPATAASADGPSNLANAVTVASAPSARGRGVLVAMNNTIHGARDATKTHGQRVEAFSSPNRGALGWVDQGKIHFYDPAPGARGPARYPLGDSVTLPRVDIVYSHAGADGVMLDAAVAAGAKGIVIAGSGAGGMTSAMRASSGEITKRGIAIVRTARHSAGSVERYESGGKDDNDSALGLSAGGSLTPPKARVLLKFLLREARTPAEVQAAIDAS